MVETARRAIQNAGYKGEPVVLLSPGDYPRINTLSLVGADMLQRCGLKVDVQTTSRSLTGLLQGIPLFWNVQRV